MGYDLAGSSGRQPEPAAGQTSRLDERALYLVDHAHCRVFLAAAPHIPREPVPD